jgi:hypothetical protein
LLFESAADPLCDTEALLEEEDAFDEPPNPDENLFNNPIFVSNNLLMPSFFAPTIFIGTPL